MPRQTLAQLKEQLATTVAEKTAALKALEDKGNENTITTFQLIAYCVAALMVGTLIGKFVL